MAQCNKVLQAEGAKSWPRTCAKCGIGKCTETELVKKDRQNDPIKQIAGLITKLSYRDMNALVTMLESSTTRDGAVDPEKLLAACDAVLADKEPA